MNIEDRFNRVVDLLHEIDPNKITILTGNNGSGKSLIRKHVHMLIAKKYFTDDSEGYKKARKYVKGVSMDTRTGSNPELGAMASWGHDSDWLATSQNTFYLIDSLFKNIDEDTKYIVLDEYEVGLSEETILALTIYLNDKISKLKEKNPNLGVLFITHSRLAIKNLIHDDFLNIEGLNKDEWLNREIKPTDLNELDKNELFFYIRDKNNS